MLKVANAIAALALSAAILTGPTATTAWAEKADPAIRNLGTMQGAEDFSSSRRGRRNTAIALGVAAGLFGIGAIAAGGYPYQPYYGYPHYGYYGYYGPAYYGGPVYVRPRVVRCWVYNPYRGIRYRTYCYR